MPAAAVRRRCKTWKSERRTLCLCPFLCRRVFTHRGRRDRPASRPTLHRCIEYAATLDEPADTDGEVRGRNTEQPAQPAWRAKHRRVEVAGHEPLEGGAARKPTPFGHDLRQ